MEDEFTMEVELNRRAKNNKDASDLWHRYKTMKSYLEKEYYPWVQANCPFFTDHGKQHIQSVIEVAGLLLNKHLSCNGKSELSSLDLFLILSGILWHDVGNVYGRSGHAGHVAEMTEKIKTLGFPNPEIHRLVVEISRAHAGKEGLNIPRPEADCAISSQIYTIYPRALAAIVRFADEISENQSRISHALLPDVPNSSRIYWEYAKCISASRPDLARERVIVTITMQHDKVTAQFTCPDFRDRVNDTGQMSLIEYVLCRLEKMNNERAYCAPEFRKYVSVREIAARFTIFRGADRLEEYDLEVAFGDFGLHQPSYPNISLCDEFFDRNPSWKPASLMEALR